MKLFISEMLLKQTNKQTHKQTHLYKRKGPKL